MSKRKQETISQEAAPNHGNTFYAASAKFSSPDTNFCGFWSAQVMSIQFDAYGVFVMKMLYFREEYSFYFS